jgi:hypothetical protein
MVFGFSIGINVTNAVFLGTPPPAGYGFSQFGIAGGYGTPIVCAFFPHLYLPCHTLETSAKRLLGITDYLTLLPSQIGGSPHR